MRFNRLRGKIREVFGSDEAFARAMKLDRSTISLKLNAKSEWSRAEMEQACLLLSIPIEEVHLYFF